MINSKIPQRQPLPLAERRHDTHQAQPAMQEYTKMLEKNILSTLPGASKNEKGRSQAGLGRLSGEGRHGRTISRL